MAIHTDSRGYKYIGNELSGITGLEMFGLNPHDSANGGGAATSEAGTAAQAILGTGQWGLGSTAPSWTNLITPGNIEWMWAPPSVPVTIDVTGYTSDLTILPDPAIVPYTFAFKINSLGSSSAVTKFAMHPGAGAKVDKIASPTSSFIFHTFPEYYASMTPNSVCFVGNFIDNTTPDNFVYMGILQGGNYSAPATYVTIMNDRTTTGGTAWRCIASGNTASVGLDLDSTYADTLASNPNTTGEPYLTRYYPFDTSGANTGLAGGYCPELYIYHGNDINTGEVIKAEDLTAGGSFDPDILDGSDFTSFMVLHSNTASKRLLMRIGDSQS